MDPFVGEIRIVPFNFAPRGWAFCDGQILPISQNTALFSLLGTQYGGNGTSNFALPNFQGSVPIGAGSSNQLGSISVGETFGENNHTLTVEEMPVHSHSLKVDSGAATSNNPSGNFFASPNVPPRISNLYGTAPGTNLNFNTVGTAGSSQPHNNQMPTLTLNFIIALQGVFPPRS